MKLVDYKNRELEVGERVRLEKDIVSVDGVLYKNSIVKIDEWNEKNTTIRVTDNMGKIWWIYPSDVSSSFL